MRMMLVLLLAAGLSAPVAAQPRAVFSTATLPSADTLDRVNLKAEWATSLPVATRNDGVLLVQAADERQVFIQTRGGLLVAIDARTGAQQWTQKLDTIPTQVFPIALNERFVIIVNLLKMYCIERYTGTIEFTYPLLYPPSAPPIVDGNLVFLTLKRDRLYAYELPKPIVMPEKLAKVKRGLGDLASSEEIKRANPVDDVVNRYSSVSRAPQLPKDQFDSRSVDLKESFSTGSSGSQKTPSMAAVATLRPPYSAFDSRGLYLQRAESLSTVASLRQPYSMRDPAKQIQSTPSLTSIPNFRNLNQLASLAPEPFKPTQLWVYGSVDVLIHPPMATEFRIWTLTDSPTIEALTKNDRLDQVRARLPGTPTAAAAQADDIAYIPMNEGSLVAIDLTSGGGSALKTLWKANVSGPMNRKPIVTADAVYIGGDTSGVAKLDRTTGDVLWRTDSTADTVVAVNAENVYVRDKLGRIRVYDRTRVRDAVSKSAVELAAADFAGFGSMAQNDKTDRIYIASDNGYLLCLRDKSAKYATPMSIAPPIHVKPPDLAKKPGDAPAPAASGDEKK